MRMCKLSVRKGREDQKHDHDSDDMILKSAAANCIHFATSTVDRRLLHRFMYSGICGLEGIGNLMIP